jgi:hypothetical protein
MVEDKLPKIKLKLKPQQVDGGMSVKKGEGATGTEIGGCGAECGDLMSRLWTVVLFRNKFRSLFTGTAELGP